MTEARGVRLNGLFSLASQRGTYRGFGFDHMIRTLAAAAVFHGIPRFLIEHDAEEENKGTLVLDNRRERMSGQKTRVFSQTVSETEGGLTCTQLNPANR